MLNELIRARFGCPVCGRILYYPLKGYWCPYCGADLVHKEAIEIQLSDSRLTARDQLNRPYYKGNFTLREKAYAQDLNLSAISEILEKLCEYEDAEEEENNSGEDNG